jgi:hypothetical protein
LGVIKSITIKIPSSGNKTGTSILIISLPEYNLVELLMIRSSRIDKRLGVPALSGRRKSKQILHFEEGKSLLPSMSSKNEIMDVICYLRVQCNDVGQIFDKSLPIPADIYQVKPFCGFC